MKTWAPVVKGFLAMAMGIALLGGLESFAGSTAGDLAPHFVAHKAAKR